MPTIPTFIVARPARAADAERGAGDDVGRVVDAEVQAARGQRDGQPVERRARQPEPPKACAAANDDVEWAEGKLRPVGVPTSGGRPSICGRRRRTTSFSAVLSR